MMMSVYGNKELEEERAVCMAEAFDYVANSCGIDIGVFMDMFITSGYAARFEENDAAVVLGLSGAELVCRVIEESGLYFDFPSASGQYKAAPMEYWTGYFFEYLRYYSGKTFRNILENISMEEFSEYVLRLIQSNETEREAVLTGLLSFVEEPVRLQEIRKECGYSQRELSVRSGVNLRTLQQYEVRAKDINKAAASTLLALSDVCGCTMKDLMEG